MTIFRWLHYWLFSDQLAIDRYAAWQRRVWRWRFKKWDEVEE